jgi:gliding motility-associated-like protein
MKQKILGIIACMMLTMVGEARHIIGGEMTYECLGEQNGSVRYRFKMLVYRDCSANFGADLDNPAPIAVYECGINRSCGSFTQLNAFRSFTTPVRNVRRVSPPNFPCLILPPNVCVEEGTYQFELTLPISNESYHIIYQRCCRNETISNISAPGDAGATYAVEITPAAQRLCNNSPTFNQFPPTVICIDQPLDFNHSATDVDGDSLVYFFCPPLLGGGRLGTPENPGNQRACNGVTPTPPCAPPHGTVQFIAPVYSFQSPLAGAPQEAINPVTGIITGTPNKLGQYVVGVCVSEYRNEQLLGTIQRDFQFNIANCSPTVVADIEKDSIINGKQFLLTSCGNNTINFINQSFQRQFVNNFFWQFNINGQAQTFTTWDATVTFPDTGRYVGALILNPNTECGDTANIFVNIFPQIEADFEFEYDTCVAGPVRFTDLSQSGAGNITNWEWNFGDQRNSRMRNPTHRYNEANNFPVTLTATDINRCKDNITKNIPYFPIPPLLIVSPSDFTGCIPAGIFFDNLSSPVDENYDVQWEFGDGGASTEISPTHLYERVGLYSVSLEITSPFGCKIDTIFRDLINVLPSPVADFTFSPSTLSNLDPTATFTDQSQNAVRWQWQMGEFAMLSERNPTFTFPDTGLQAIRLIVTHPSGCQDSITKFLDVVPEVRYFLPNAFTPNSDNINDLFRGTGILVGATDFIFTIWNRWGEKVFETEDPEEGWNGRKFNTGRESPPGIYVCIVQFTGPRGERYEFQTFATLIR